MTMLRAFILGLTFGFFAAVSYEVTMYFLQKWEMSQCVTDSECEAADGKAI